MHDEPALIQRLDRLERSVRRQRLLLGALALLLSAWCLAAASTPEPDEVRAQRFVAVDDQGREVGRFGFDAEPRSVGWRLDDPQAQAHAFCMVGKTPSPVEDGAETSLALFQMEAGWAISQHVVRADAPAIGLSFVLGKDEKTALQLAADGESSRLSLSPLPHSDDLLGEGDDSHLLELADDEHGPSIRGVALDGAAAFTLPGD